MKLFSNTRTLLALTIIVQVISTVSAQTILDGETVFAKVVENIFSPLYQLMVGLAICYFLYGVVKFIIDIRNPEKKTTGKSHLVWGMVGLFIILSIGGILPTINSVLGGMFTY